MVKLLDNNIVTTCTLYSTTSVRLLGLIYCTKEEPHWKVSMAHDQHLLWTTKGSKASRKDPNLDHYSLYDFFSNANAARLRQGRPIQRIKSAAPRIGQRHLDGKDSVAGSPLGSHVSLRNPSSTP